MDDNAKRLNLQPVNGDFVDRTGIKMMGNTPSGKAQNLTIEKGKWIFG